MVSRINMSNMTQQEAMELSVAVTWLLAEYYCERGPKFARKFMSWDYNTASLTHFLLFVCAICLFFKKNNLPFPQFHLAQG